MRFGRVEIAAAFGCLGLPVHLSSAGCFSYVRMYLHDQRAVYRIGHDMTHDSMYEVLMDLCVQTCVTHMCMHCVGEMICAWTHMQQAIVFASTDKGAPTNNAENYAPTIDAETREMQQHTCKTVGSLAS